MKTHFDFQIFSIQDEGGISVYYERLYDELSKIMEVQASCLFTQNHHSPTGIYFSPQLNFPYLFSIKYYPNLAYSYISLCRKDFNIFHPTYYDPYFLSIIGDKPFVLTIFDMIHERFSNNFNKNDPTSKRKKLLAIKAAKIIAISESTKKDLVEIYSINPNKIKVIPLAVDRNSQNIICDKSNTILFLGKRTGYKNFNFMLRAIANLLIDMDMRLVCVGGGKLSLEELKLIQHLGLKKHVTQIELNDVGLAAFYSETLLLIYPSLYEGFGLPILEAFSFGCPVVCSNTSSMPEIGSNGAVYFDPRSMEDIKIKVEMVIRNQKLRMDMIKKGRKILKNYSWEKTAAETFKVYKEVLNSYEKKTTS